MGDRECWRNRSALWSSREPTRGTLLPHTLWQNSYNVSFFALPCPADKESRYFSFIAFTLIVIPQNKVFVIQTPPQPFSLARFSRELVKPRLFVRPLFRSLREVTR